MAAAIANRLERWAAGWARRRQGIDPPNVVLARRRIYVLPTAFGLAFGLMVFAMLLGSLNYGSSLGFMLTFLLASFGLVAMHHCHNNLLGARVRFAGAAPVFAGETATFRFVLGNDAAVPRCDLEVTSSAGATPPLDVAARSTALTEVQAPTSARGWVRLERFGIATRYPGRLFRAWTWIHMDARCLVYPKPAPPGRPLPMDAGFGATGRTERGDDDFASLRTAAPGDPPQRIAWKAYARSELLLVKQFAGGDREPALLDWDALPDLAPEQRLAQLARWCLDAAAEERAFGLRLPGIVLPPQAGREHLHECLAALALHEVANA
jgi:uncharacterized protein (DUF58 family)